MNVLFLTKNLFDNDDIRVYLASLREKLEVYDNKEIENEC
jgi:hypothetical protein